jgi:hypothetical protein
MWMRIKAIFSRFQVIDTLQRQRSSIVYAEAHTELVPGIALSQPFLASALRKVIRL